MVECTRAARMPALLAPWEPYEPWECFFMMPGGAAGGLQGRSRQMLCLGDDSPALGESRGQDRHGAGPLEGRRGCGGEIPGREHQLAPSLL